MLQLTSSGIKKFARPGWPTCLADLCPRIVTSTFGPNQLQVLPKDWFQCLIISIDVQQVSRVLLLA